MAKISLIIPVYNVALYIERCIISIINQTFSDFEAIFVNDGSTDSSAEICKRLIAPYQNMRMINKKNGGLSSARLCGFHKAEGEYICFIDSDDYLAPTYLQTLYDAITTNDADVSMCEYFTNNGKEQVEQKLYFKDEVTIINKDKIMEEYVLTQIPSIDSKDNRLPSFLWLRMFKKEMLDDSFFICERDVYIEDFAACLTLFKRINRLAITKSPEYYYCINPGSMTLRYRENMWEMLINLYKMICETITDDYSDEFDRRRKGFIFNSISYSLRNSTLKGFSNFWKVAKLISSNVKVKEVLYDTKIINLHSKNLLLAICYHTSTIPLLYFYYRRRSMP